MTRENFMWLLHNIGYLVDIPICVDKYLEINLINTAIQLSSNLFGSKNPEELNSLECVKKFRKEMQSFYDTGAFHFNEGVVNE